MNNKSIPIQTRKWSNEIEVGDVVLIEILKQEQTAIVLYIDTSQRYVGVDIFDATLESFDATHITPKSQNKNDNHEDDHGLLIPMKKIRRKIPIKDILKELYLYKRKIKEAQNEQMLLDIELSKATNERNVMRDLNKPCVLKGISVHNNYNEDDDQEQKFELIDEDEFDEEYAQLYDNYGDDSMGNLMDEMDGTSPISKLSMNMSNDAAMINGPSILENESLSSEDFDILKTLGIGACARVKLSRYISTNKYYALKMFEKSKVIENTSKVHIEWEQKLLTDLKPCPFICQLIRYFNDDERLYWVLELINGGDLFALIRENHNLSVEWMRFYSAQMVYTLKYLHCEKNILFRDLKPENVLIDKFGFLKFTDFGVSKHLTDERTFTLCGTPEYLAPELLINKGYSYSVDWWAFGVLCFEMLTGHTPFHSDRCMNIYNQIFTEKISFEDLKDEHDELIIIDNETQTFVKQLLIKNPNKRLNDPKEIMNHDFYSNLDWDQIIMKTYQNVPWIPDIINDQDTRYFDEYSDHSGDDHELLTYPDNF